MAKKETSAAGEKSFEQVVAMKRQAVLFAENVLQNYDLADELDDLTPDEYAARKGLSIVRNPQQQGRTMATKRPPTRVALEERIAELEEENSELHERLDSICELSSADEDDDDDDEEEEE